MGGYNADIELEDDVIAERYSAIRPALTSRFLREDFRRFDSSAKRWKRTMIWTGGTALALGVGAIMGVAAELYAGAVHLAVPWQMTLAIEIAAILSVAIWLFDRVVLRSRFRYRSACFARERLRQWRFQMFLDGEFVEALATDPSGRAINRRLARVVDELKSLPTAMIEFLNAGERELFFHSVTPYSDPAVQEDVFAAVLDLRFRHQSQYARRRLSGDEGRAVSLVESLGWIEVVGRTALLAAVAIPAIQLGLMFFIDHHSVGTHVVHGLQASLFVATIAAAVISAGARALAAGLGLPFEIESYQEYVARVDALRSQFEAAPPQAKLRLMRELEFEAERELRRFLIIKGRATFVL